MDVSFSAWRHSREESLQLKGDSFSFLFDRRYTNRLNRMSRVFFEAYVAATRELAAQEDRFPSLSEIDAKMESGAVYAFKDRLMKNTEFFEEIKISGVSYLVPRALRFIDSTGTYTDLVLNFEEGTVVMPSRRKTPAPPSFSGSASPEPKEEPEAFTVGPEEYPAHASEPLVEERVEADSVAVPPAQAEEEASIRTPPPGRGRMIRPMAAVAGALLLLIAAGMFILPERVSEAPVLVEYRAYLSSHNNSSYLGLDVLNPEGIGNELAMQLPPDIDQGISARGGTVTISHSEGTLVRLNSSTDASVRVYLQRNWTTVPVSLSLAGPGEYDSSLAVNGTDYLVTRKNGTLFLVFNLTEEGVAFEQSYRRKR